MSWSVDSSDSNPIQLVNNTTLYTPPSTDTSSASRPDAMDNEIHVQLRVAGQWSDAKVPARFSPKLIAGGFARPAADSSAAHAQAAAHEAPVPGFSTTMAGGLSGRLFDNLDGRGYTPRLFDAAAQRLSTETSATLENQPKAPVLGAPRNDVPGFATEAQRKAPGKKQSTLYQGLLNRQLGLQGWLTPKAATRSRLVPVKTRFGTGIISPIVSNAGSELDSGAAPANAADLEYPLPFESHLRRLGINTFNPNVSAAHSHAESDFITDVNLRSVEAVRDPAPSADEESHQTPHGVQMPILKENCPFGNSCAECYMTGRFDWWREAYANALAPGAVPETGAIGEASPSTMIRESKAAGNFSKMDALRKNDAATNPDSQPLGQRFTNPESTLRVECMPGSWDNPFVGYEPSITRPVSGPAVTEYHDNSYRASILPTQPYQTAQDNVPDIYSDTTWKAPPPSNHSVTPLVLPDALAQDDNRCRGCIWGCDFCCPIQAEEVLNVIESSDDGSWGYAQSDIEPDEVIPPVDQCNVDAAPKVWQNEQNHSLRNHDQAWEPSMEENGKTSNNTVGAYNVDASAQAQQNEQNDRLGNRDWAWGPSMETVNRGDNTFSISAQAKQNEGFCNHDPAWGPLKRIGIAWAGCGSYKCSAYLHDREEAERWADPAGDWRSLSTISNVDSASSVEPRPTAESEFDIGFAPNTRAPTKPVRKDLTVTYWATVEDGDRVVHIPIDAHNVTGPEKDVVNMSMKKLWKWVQDKGLEDKISLQDAYDLAVEMHPQSHAKSDENNESSNTDEAKKAAGSGETGTDTAPCAATPAVAAVPAIKSQNPISTSNAFTIPSSNGSLIPSTLRPAQTELNSCAFASRVMPTKSQTPVPVPPPPPYQAKLFPYAPITTMSFWNGLPPQFRPTHVQPKAHPHQTTPTATVAMPVESQSAISPPATASQDTRNTSSVLLAGLPLVQKITKEEHDRADAAIDRGARLAFPEFFDFDNGPSRPSPTAEHGAKSRRGCVSPPCNPGPTTNAFFSVPSTPEHAANANRGSAFTLQPFPGSVENGSRGATMYPYNVPARVPNGFWSVGVSRGYF
ncbi:hypothetical protein K458DRAFT_24710 [Lentithecium fluviatile CBS 122367]|uniref:Uncharacterized protein n=1 Tax=Lentithecium fluviatile CBS 122367 TaxID=1168545 RepID=A0A6G1J4K5_9PLEO|nr:hypothetical protein K458DRAFT_24710 [Lentithecium fluviatile CBS 122367]